MTDITRAQFLARSAATGAAFAVPLILTIEPAAAADLTSPPPRPPGETELAPPTRVERHAGSGGTLPMTGADLGEMGVVGLLACAGGAVIRLVNGRPVVDPTT